MASGAALATPSAGGAAGVAASLILSGWQQAQSLELRDGRESEGNSGWGLGSGRGTGTLTIYFALCA
jgi:hypothetical protein